MWRTITLHSTPRWRSVCIGDVCGEARVSAGVRAMDPTANSPKRCCHLWGTLPLILLLAVAGLYILSLGPILWYSGKPVMVMIIGGTAQPPSGAMPRGRTVPRWVSALYRPVFLMLGSQLTPSYGSQDPVNIYKRYIKWWHDRP